jgi:hypothetical protein
MGPTRPAGGLLTEGRKLLALLRAAQRRSRRTAAAKSAAA